MTIAQDRHAIDCTCDLPVQATAPHREVCSKSLINDETFPLVAVGPFRVADATQAQLIDLLVSKWCTTRATTIAFALHIGGIRQHKDDRFVDSMNRAHVTYADGIAPVILAKLNRASWIERAPTTDIGWDLIQELARREGRRARVALIGGKIGLAQQAGESLVVGSQADLVYAADGYRSDWTQVLAELAASRPDVVFVGMGMPREADWVTRHFDALPTALILTCGGWFGFLAGHERRSPRLLQRLGLEWTWRLMQQPRRLAGRYAFGAIALCALILRSVASPASKRGHVDPSSRLQDHLPRRQAAGSGGTRRIDRHPKTENG